MCLKGCWVSLSSSSDKFFSIHSLTEVPLQSCNCPLKPAVMSVLFVLLFVAGEKQVWGCFVCLLALCVQSGINYLSLMTRLQPIRSWDLAGFGHWQLINLYLHTEVLLGRPVRFVRGVSTRGSGALNKHLLYAFFFFFSFPCHEECDRSFRRFTITH